MASLPSEIRNDAVRSLLAKVSEIAVLPQVVYKIIELTSNTGTAVHEIESAIAIDPGFSSKVLMLANSAYYALPKKLTSIREATTFLGFKTIRQLAMTVGVFDMFVGKTDEGSLRRRKWWRHSVDTAICAQSIAKIVRTVAPDEAYSCGLLHDVGKPILDRYGDGNFGDVERLVSCGLKPLAAEQEAFGCTHADIGGAAAESWRFPQPLFESVAFHHVPPPDEIPTHVAITAMANEFAHAMVEGRRQFEDDHEYVSGFSRWAVETLGFTAEKIDEAFAICKDAVANGSAKAA